jgi:phosphatidate cytidylyltransferase
MPARLRWMVGGLFGLGGLLLALAQTVRHAPVSERRADWVKYGLYILLIWGLFWTAAAGRGLTAGILILLTLAGTMEIARALHGRTSAVVIPLSLLLLLAAFAHLLPGDAARWPARFETTVLLVAVADAYAQLWGRLLGRHRLCPRLSPGKTVEGLIGGLGTTVAVSLTLRFLNPDLSLAGLALHGLLIGSGAVAGDLFFSRLKRIAGIKDFSRLLPGHGGVLDRFDSLVVAAPVAFWSRWLLVHCAAFR